MTTTDDLGPQLTTAFARILAHLDAEAPDDLTGQLKAWQRCKGERGRKGIAEALGMHEAEIAMFDAALRDVERAGGSGDGDDEAAQRNARLANLRLLSWFETIGQRTPALALDADVEAMASEDLGRKQVRAVELIVRSLITESYGDQDALVARLREALNERVVEKWRKSADAGDILSGCSFSELASLFVSKEEFGRYEKLYEDTPFLTLLKQRRKTIQSFLDDIRRVRNVLAHNKKVTPIQLSLLDLYYEEIVTPIQTAHDHGETKVDPEDHLDVSKADLDAYVADLHEDVEAVRDDLQELRTEVMASLGSLEASTGRIEEATSKANQKLYYIAGGVVAAIALIIFLISQTGDTQEAVEDTRETAKRTEEAVKETAEGVSDLKEGQAEIAKATEEAAEASKETAAATKETAEAAKETAAATKETAAATKEIAEGVKETSEKVAENTEKVTEAAKDMEEATAATKEAAEGMEEAADKIVQTADELRAGFSALTQAGGIIAKPRRPQEWYHNARMYEQRGDYAKALQSYQQFFQFDELVFVDPHLRFQTFLKLQRGLPGAREVYYELKKDSDNVAMQFAWNLLLDGEARAKGLDAFLEANPKFAPAVYARSRDYSIARLGTQAFADKRREKELLTTFLALKDESNFLEHYLDQAVAAEQVKDAEERFALLANISDEALKNPVKITGNRSGMTWMLTIMVSDMPREILYRIDGKGDFKSTGHNDGAYSYNGNPIPVMTIEVRHEDRTRTISVKYMDQKKEMHGPFDIEFDPDEMFLRTAKSTLGFAKSGWGMLKQIRPGQVLLYFTTVLAYRGALKEIRYGLDTETPDRSHPFSKPDPKNPLATRPSDKSYIQVPNGTKFATMQLIFKDGTKSEIVKFMRQ